MFTKQDDLRAGVFAVSEILKADNLEKCRDVLTNAVVTIDNTGYDNWNGGTNYYTIYLTIDIETFVKIRDRVQIIESTILEKFSLVSRHIEDENITTVRIVPKVQPRIDWSKLGGTTSKQQLVEDVNFLKSIMIAVSTGASRIQNENTKYIQKYAAVDQALKKLNFSNPNSFTDLWQWYGKWSADFRAYQERRTYIGQMYNVLIQSLEETQPPEMITVTVNLTDWERIERTVNEIKSRQAEAKVEEQFQAIGLLCRENIINLAQAIYDKEKHTILDGAAVSKTDAKRMLEAYIAVELAGSSNETMRKYAKATLDLANEVVHKRAASKKEATICTTAKLGLINFIGTIEGKI